MKPLSYQDGNFGKKAVEMGFLSQQTWQEYKRDWEEENIWGVDIVFVLIDDGVLSSEQAQVVFESLKEAKTLKQLGEYSILGTLGKGGMGSVYKAQRGDEILAIKVMDQDFLGSEIHVKRFFREIQSITTLDHPNIVKALDFGADLEKQIYFVAMEFVDGTNLRDLITKEGPMSPLKALKYTKEVAKALQYGFENHIIHRDIKPENILLGAHGEIKVADFGLAKNLEAEGITQTGTMLGTPYYMSPELSQGEKNITIQSDVYSLGITLYYFLVGKPPFYKGNSMQIIMNHMMDPVPSLEDSRKDLTPNLRGELDSLIGKMTAKMPGDRVLPDELIQWIDVLEVKIQRGSFRGGHRSSTVIPVLSTGAPKISQNQDSPIPALPGQGASQGGPFPSAGRLKPITQTRISALPPQKEDNTLVWIFVALGLLVLALLVPFFWLLFNG